MPWEWFPTLTFRDDRVHPERADKLFRFWMNRLHDARFGKHWRRRNQQLTWARATEIQSRGAPHFHALIAGVGDVRRLTFMDLWDELAGMARIWPVNDQDLVAQYITK
jgi:hypothetical protein